MKKITVAWSQCSLKIISGKKMKGSTHSFISYLLLCLIIKCELDAYCVPDTVSPIPHLHSIPSWSRSVHLNNWTYSQVARWMLVPTPWGGEVWHQTHSIPSKFSLILTLSPGNPASKQEIMGLVGRGCTLGNWGNLQPIPLPCCRALRRYYFLLTRPHTETESEGWDNTCVASIVDVRNV